MRDQEIRKILISYLKVRYERIRIYQEKAIGKSVCDLMAVTDRITGYEIKSDLDNYSRIKMQVSSYQTYFNENYIVVGKSHEGSVVSKVPSSWGIIVITGESVSVYREAKDNREIFIKAQLSMLWKLELSNILSYFRMPMFAQKGKDYIIDRLLEEAPQDQLEKQIAYELLERDYSVFGATDYSLYFENDWTTNSCIENIVDGASEIEQMTLDQWIEIYSQVQSVRKAKQEKIEVKKKERPKHAITYKDIEVYPGVPWIRAEYITDFAKQFSYHSRAICDKITGNWFITDKNDANYNYNVRATTELGLPKYNALYILEATLNLREIKIYKNNGTKREYDENSTVMALEKQKLLIEEFKKWVWKDEDRIWEIEEAYNKTFGAFQPKRFDGSNLEFPGMESSVSLYDYQRDAVQKILSSKNTLLAFDVGAGKTYIMIAAAMLMRQRGIAKKNMFVVPNNIVGQWAKIFTDLYPHANLLVVEPKGFRSPVRDKVIKQMKIGDYDGIIMAYSCFEMIPLSIQCIRNSMQEKLDAINEEVKKIGYTNCITHALEAEKKRLKDLANELIKSMDYESFSVNFDDLEVDALFLDEAHNYKNLPIKTKMRNIRGINTNGSKKCLDMLQKVRVVQDNRNAGCVVFATGTPLCNSLADTYTMQFYLQYEEMERLDLDKFDNWIKTFAKPEIVAEIDVDTQHYRHVRRFAQFYNLPELSKMFSDIAVFYSMENMEGLPEKVAYKDCVIPHNEALSEYMLTLAERTEEIRNGKVDPITGKKVKVSPMADNMLKVSTDGRKAALDLRLTGNEQPEETSKVRECVDNVKAVYDQFEFCAQIVFCDYSTPKKDEFNVYAEIKNRLIEKQIPEEEIAFVHSYHTEERKIELYNQVNEGKIRVLIGSTFKLGIGANVQQRLKAIHHLDVPWRPADMVQREGRIVRRGNTYEDVIIYRYVCEGSFDSYSWQILENKQKFISQFLIGSAYQRTASDLEENVLDYAEVKALALADPRMKELAEKENELTNLMIVNNQYSERKEQLKNELENDKKDIVSLEGQIKGTEENIERIKNKKEEEYKLLRQILAELLIPEDIVNGGKLLGTVWGFEILSPRNQNEKKQYILLKNNETEYRIECGDSSVGNAQRVSNFLSGLEDYMNKLKNILSKKQSHLEDIQNEMRKQNPYKTNLNQLKREVSELRKQIYENNE